MLDAFAGSGVTGERCLRHGRFSVLVERLQQTIEQYILPRLAAAVAPAVYQPGVQATLF